MMSIQNKEPDELDRFKPFVSGEDQELQMSLTRQWTMVCKIWNEIAASGRVVPFVEG